MPFDITTFRTLRTDEPGDRLQGAALECYNLIPQSSTTMRVREGSSGVKEYKPLQEGRNLSMDALPEELGGGILILVVKTTPAAPSGGTIALTNVSESVFEFRPAHIPSEFQTLAGFADFPEVDIAIET